MVCAEAAGCDPDNVITLQLYVFLFQTYFNLTWTGTYILSVVTLR